MYLGDVFTDWAAAVKASGGNALSFPPDAQSGPANGTFRARPAARYLTTTALALGLGQPDFTTVDGSYEYFLAPPNVIAFVTGGGLVDQGSLDAGAAAVTPDWAKQIQKLLKYAAIGAAAAGVVWFVAPIVRAKLSKR